MTTSSNEISEVLLRRRVFLLTALSIERLREGAHALIRQLLHTEQDSHPDVHWMHPEGKVHLYGREMLLAMRRDAYLTPCQGLYKIYVLEEAEKMLTTQSNILLKILEEPPLRTCFLLLTLYEGKILPTIRSRALHCPLHEELKERASTSIATLFLQVAHLVWNHGFSSQVFSFLDELDQLMMQKDQESLSQEMHALFHGWLCDVRDRQQRASYHDKLPSLDRMIHIIEQARLSLERNIKPRFILEYMLRQWIG